MVEEAEEAEEWVLRLQLKEMEAEVVEEALDGLQLILLQICRHRCMLSSALVGQVAPVTPLDLPEEIPLLPRIASIRQWLEYYAWPEAEGVERPEART